jgi:hypothetical protein
MDPNEKPAVEVRQAMRHPLRDPAWPGKLGLGALFCVLSLLLVGIPIVLGWLRRLFLDVVRDPDARLPEWNPGEDFVDGLPALLVVAVYALAGSLLLEVPVFGWLLALVPGFLLPAALTGLFAMGRVSAAFDLVTMLEYVRDNLANYLLGIVLGLVAAVVSLVGLLALLVGVFATAFWAMAVTTHVWAQVYRNSKLVTPHPVAVRPEPAVPVASPATPAST